MLALLKKAIAWLQSKEPKWFQQNSWVNEGAVGALLTLALCWWLHGSLWAVLVFNALSYVYERWLDPSKDRPGHQPVDDIGQRAAGSLLVAWVWSAL